jgi:hypothetical protein
VMSPDSTIRNIIDFISFVLIIYLSLYIPFTFSFDISPGDSVLKYFELLIDLWFLLEICFNFFTGFVKNGRHVTVKKMIAMQYLKTWFAADLVSSIPFSILYFVSIDN